MPNVPLVTYPFDPDAFLPFEVNWGPWLEGATLTTVTWTPSNALVTVESDSLTEANTVARAWIRGAGNEGECDVVLRATASDGRIDDRTIHLRVADR